MTLGTCQPRNAGRPAAIAVGERLGRLQEQGHVRDQATGVTRTGDELTSWPEAPAKWAILEFLDAVTDPESRHFVRSCARTNTACATDPRRDDPRWSTPA